MMQFNELHLELTSNCQASCPGCSRIYEYTPHLTHHRNTQTWSLIELEKFINPFIKSSINSLFLCGNYGDPLAHPDISPWLKILNTKVPRLNIHIHTNGGLGTTATWEHLGRILNQRTKKVTFSIDGLEETNHIYRRGVEWKNIMQNAQTFIKNGGWAIWKMIEFEHNKTVIEECKQMAKEMGFKDFKLAKPYTKDDYFKIPDAQDLPKNLIVDYRDQSLQNLVSNKGEPKEIDCKAIKENSLYIDAEKKVWPCCWISQEGDFRYRTKRRELFHRTFNDRYNEGFNQLGPNKNIEYILKHSFFTSDLKESWKKENHSQCPEHCQKICGIPNGK